MVAVTPDGAAPPPPPAVETIGNTVEAQTGASEASDSDDEARAVADTENNVSPTLPLIDALKGNGEYLGECHIADSPEASFPFKGV